MFLQHFLQSFSSLTKRVEKLAKCGYIWLCKLFSFCSSEPFSVVSFMRVHIKLTTSCIMRVVEGTRAMYAFIKIEYCFRHSRMQLDTSNVFTTCW